MNINRSIWITTTTLFGLVGVILGWAVGVYYTQLPIQGVILKGLQSIAVDLTLSLSVGVLAARLGSWIADRIIIRGVGRMQQFSAADRLLGIAGVLVGGSFGVLLGLMIPSVSLFLLPVKVCIMAVSASMGMAMMQGLRAEILHVFPQLEEDPTASDPGFRITSKLLDTNVIIDGRMADLCRTGFIEGTLFVPSFVLDEVQYIADSADSLRRARGRRGLDVLNAMREIQASDEERPLVNVLHDIPESVQALDNVDSKLVMLAKEMNAAIVTNDFNLNRVAELQGVTVLNINQLAQALKPVVLPGEEMAITIVKEGKEPGQGVGYLDDGTMVVVGDGNRHVGETCSVTITSVYQTVQGKMIFAELRTPRRAGEDPFPGSNTRNDSTSDSDDLNHRSGGGLRRKGRF